MQKNGKTMSKYGTAQFRNIVFSEFSLKKVFAALFMQ
jgi:hypothetical protein